MLRALIVKVVNLEKEIEEKKPTIHKSKRSQRLLDSEDWDEKLANEEQKKERRKNHKEQGDGYRQGVFCQKCHNEGHLIKECKLLHIICNICWR
jgi:hypothetical protein